MLCRFQIIIVSDPPTRSLSENHLPSAISLSTSSPSVKVESLNGLITVPFQQTEAQRLEQRSALVQPSFSGCERDPAS